MYWKRLIIISCATRAQIRHFMATLNSQVRCYSVKETKPRIFTVFYAKLPVIRSLFCNRHNIGFISRQKDLQQRWDGMKQKCVDLIRWQRGYLLGRHCFLMISHCGSTWIQPIITSSLIYRSNHILALKPSSPTAFSWLQFKGTVGIFDTSY